MAKHFLYLTNDKLVALIWSGGAITGRDVFRPTDADSQAFQAYIARHRDVPTYLVTDLIEEDFRTDTVPHLRGGDRDAVLGRRLAQLYRASTYRHAIVQGREEDGRRDDRVLYHAVTNAEVLDTWVAAVSQAEVPLEGIYSSAVLSGALLSELNIVFPHTLLVTIVPDFGLRQTYFRNKQIKFSRLTPIIYDEGQSVGTLIAAEASRTWQYLDSLRNFAGDDALEVCILVHARDRQMIADAIRNYPLFKYRFLDIEEVAARLKLRPAPVSSHAEEVLVHVYARGSQENHFASKEQTRAAGLRRARFALYGLTAAVLAIGVGVTAFNFYQANNVSGAIEKRNLASKALQTEYQIVADSMRGATTATAAVRDASAFYHAQILPHAPNPGPILRDLGTVWAEFPELKLWQLVWAPTMDAAYTPAYTSANTAQALNVRSEIKVAPGSQPAPGANPAGGTMDENPALPGSKFEVAIIEGSVTGFSGDYRGALATVERLANRLNATPNMSASIIAMPVDVTPVAILHGSTAASGSSEARFTLRVARAKAGS
jgi:hypothetical protein